MWEKVGSKSQNSSEDDTLNEGRLASAEEESVLKISHVAKDSVIVSVPNVLISSPNDQDRSGKTCFPPTSTPMVSGTVDEKKTDDLHESYIDNPANETVNLMTKPNLHPPHPMIITPVMKFMRRKSRPMDLVFFNSPRMSPASAFSPMTPAIKAMLTPCIREPSLVPLNTVAKPDKPLHIVHPITGKIHFIA